MNPSVDRQGSLISGTSGPRPPSGSGRPFSSCSLRHPPPRGRLCVPYLPDWRVDARPHNRPAGGRAVDAHIGFSRSAHEVGEDVPALFFFLLVVYLALRYLETGNESHFLAGYAIGGFATAVKLSAGTGVFVLGVTFSAVNGGA